MKEMLTCMKDAFFFLVECLNNYLLDEVLDSSINLKLFEYLYDVIGLLYFFNKQVKSYTTDTKVKNMSY